MREKPFAPSSARNSDAILDVLRHELRGAHEVLEIGSGTGQHAVNFALAMPHVLWQTSDLVVNHAGIEAWISESGADNVLLPLPLDVLSDDASPQSYDAAYSANTAHIMGIDAVEAMFRLVGRGIRNNGRFCLYGPFRRGGEFNTSSNARFDQQLRAKDAAMGIRDIERLDDFAADNGMVRSAFYNMPANNHIAVWIKSNKR